MADDEAIQSGNIPAPALEIIEHSSAFMRHVEETIFSTQPISFYSGIAPETLVKWRIPRWKILLSPFGAQSWEAEGFFGLSWGLLFLVIWIFLSAVWTLTLFSYDPSLATGIDFHQPSLTAGTIIVGIVMVACAALAYMWAVTFLASKRNSWWIKVFWALVLIVVGAINTFKYKNTIQTILQLITSSPFSVPALILWCILVPIPIGLWMVLLYEYATLGLGWGAVFLFMNFVRTNNIYTHRHLKKILDTAIPFGDKSFFLLNLPVDELCSLKEWARDSREGTDKRIVPASIFLALLGVLFNSPSITTWADGWIAYGNSQLASIPQNILGIPVVPVISFLISILGPVLLGLLLIILASYFQLFRNLVVQSYIIEACTVAEFAARRADVDRQRLEAVRAKKHPWWINWLCKKDEAERG
jgi:hypothetical protein